MPVAAVIVGVGSLRMSVLELWKHWLFLPSYLFYRGERPVLALYASCILGYATCAAKAHMHN
jgi:hypothetical protein